MESQKEDIPEPKAIDIISDSDSENTTLFNKHQHTIEVDELKLLPSDDESLEIEEFYVSPKCEYPSFYTDTICRYLPNNEHVALIKSQN